MTRNMFCPHANAVFHHDLHTLTPPDISVGLLGVSVQFFGGCVVITPDDGAVPPQKRDIQLLKAYMRAIRSANPNLQNLEESIEYNEILE